MARKECFRLFRGLKMNYKKLYKKERNSKLYHKDMTKHYKELFETSVSELKFKNMQVSMLVWELEFIQEATNDKLVKNVIDIVLARKINDDLFHSRNLFDKKD